MVNKIQFTIILSCTPNPSFCWFLLLTKYQKCLNTFRLCKTETDVNTCPSGMIFTNLPRFKAHLAIFHFCEWDPFSALTHHLPEISGTYTTDFHKIYSNIHFTQYFVRVRISSQWWGICFLAPNNDLKKWKNGWYKQFLPLAHRKWRP